MATTSCCGNSCFRRNQEFPGRTAGLNPLCAEWLLVSLAFRWQDGAAFGVFGRLQVTHINLRFVFLFFAHITFLSLLVVFLVLGCVSRAEIFAAANDLFVWDQVVQTDQLIFGTLLPLSSTLPRIRVLFFLRRTHMRPITTIYAMWFSPSTSSAIRSF